MPLVAAAAITAGGAYMSSRSASKAADKSAQASQQAANVATAEQRRQYDLSRADQMPWLQAGQGALGQLARLYGINQQGAQPAVTQLTPQAPQGGYGGNQLTPSGNYSVPAYSGRQNGTYAQMMQMVDNGQLQGDPASMATAQYGQAQPVPMQATPQPQTQGGQFDTFWQSPDYNFRQNEQMRALTARNAALGIQDSGAAQRSALQLSGNLASSEYNNYANRLAALAGVGQTAANTTAQLGQNYAGAVGNIAMSNANNLASSYQQKGQAQQALWGNLASIGSGLFANGGFGR